MKPATFKPVPLSGTELKIMDLEEELRKQKQNPSWRNRGNPRRLRRLLRRLRSKKDAPAMAK